MLKVKLFISFFILSGLLHIFAKPFQLGELFNEGVVLQRNAEVEIWGTGNAGDRINIEIQDKTATGIVDSNGRWNIVLPALKEGGPYQMTVSSGSETISLDEVYVGEVWIAAGQSNMAWQLEKSENGEEHILNAKNENIRFVLVPQKYYEEHRVKGDMNWRTATTGNVGQMSGVAYFFAKDLQEKLQVPVGVICCYKGGTAAEAWMDREVILSDPRHAPIVESYESYLLEMGEEKYNSLYAVYEDEMKIYRDSVKKGFTKAVRPTEPMGEKHYKRPYGLYNTMVKRIIPYTARGVIWYQGEANAPRAEQYRTLFPALIQEWRTDFKNPDMPFLFVQLANYDHPKYNYPAWAELREAQLKTWQNVKNTGMAVTMDVGEKNDIHPIYKEPVGDRLALIALNQVYGYNVPYSGPVFKKVEFQKGKAILSFDYIEKGLSSANGTLRGFTISGSDEKFVPATAEISGDKIIVSSDKVKNPVSVRYNWENWGEGNLTNSTGLPATPFRTDDFKLVTAGKKSQKY